MKASPMRWSLEIHSKIRNGHLQHRGHVKLGDKPRPEDLHFRPTGKGHAFSLLGFHQAQVFVEALVDELGANVERLVLSIFTGSSKTKSSGYTDHPQAVDAI